MAKPAAKRRRDWTSLALTLGLAPLALVWLAPLWLMFIFATLPDPAIFSPTIRLLPGRELLTNVGFLMEKAAFGRAMANSIGIASAYALLSVLLTSMAGYAFARFGFIGR